MAVVETARLEFRTDQQKKSEIEEAAELLGMTVTSFAMATLLEKARKVKQEFTSFTILSNRDRDIFLDMLDNPPAPSQALLDLLSGK